MITAEVVADSITHYDKRITTMVLTYPRMVHAEFMTHRMFSRNAASSRAIPIKKMIEKVETDPAMPVYWGKNQPGMQAAEELQGQEREDARQQWLSARDAAVTFAKSLSELGVHKQIANRVLEPFMNITVIVTATEWANFYFQRRHKAAQPEIQALANAMWDAQQASTPAVIYADEWHLPYMTEFEKRTLKVWTLAQCASARCARVSYLNHDGSTPSIEKDLELFAKLTERTDPSDPGHWSPLEHPATPEGTKNFASGNFIGWKQFRKMQPSENQK